MPNKQLLTWWESLREQEQYALRKTYKQQTGNSFLPQNLSHLVELETWDLAHTGLVSLDFIRPFVRIKRLIVSRNPSLKKLNGIEQAPSINYLECTETPLRYQPILKKCPNLKSVMSSKGEIQTPQDWEEDCKVSAAYDFCQLPLPLLKCLYVNLKLKEEGANPWGVTNIYDMYLRYLGQHRIDINAPSLALEEFQELTVIVVDFQFKSNYIQDLDWLRFFPKLQYLDCSFNQLTDLLGIAYCPDLQILHCQDNQISDISPILECPKLHTINCSINKITDGSALLSHPNLFKIGAQGNTIIKSPLIIPTYTNTLSKEAYYKILPNQLKFELTKYCKEHGIFEPTDDNPIVPYPIIKNTKTIHISFERNILTELHSLEWLAIFSDLHFLDCSNNRITDLSPLKYCPNLQRLTCNNNNISDFAPINKLPKLNALFFSDNPTTDICNVQILHQLEVCIAENTPLNKRSQLAFAYNNVNAGEARFVNMWEPLLTEREKELMLMNYYFVLQKKRLPMHSDWLNIDQIFSRNIGKPSLNPRDMKGINNISRIKSLNLNNYQLKPLTNLFFLQGLTYLEDLDCCFNQLTNFAGLEQAIDLRQIDAAFNALTSLQGLQNCHKLQSLNLQNNPIKDISLLAHCKNLRIIHLNHTPIEHLRDFDELHDLEFLYIGDTKISADEISRFARLHPDCIIDNSL